VNVAVRDEHAFSFTHGDLLGDGDIHTRPDGDFPSHGDRQPCPNEHTVLFGYGRAIIDGVIDFIADGIGGDRHPGASRRHR